MKRIFSLAALLLAACASAPAAGTDAKFAFATLSGEAPIIIAHWSASDLYPEHTIKAYTAAIEQGADFIEPDLVTTKDGVLIARHDHYLSATTNVADHPEFADRRRVRETPLGKQDDWWTDDFTLAEIKTLKARQQFKTRSMEFNDQLDIVTFDEVIDLVLAEAANGRKVGLHIEAKWPGYFSSVGLDMVDPILNALEKKGVTAAGIPVSIQCFEPPFLSALSAKSDLPTIQNMVGPPYAALMGMD